MCGFIRKQYLESFAFLILRILELLTLKVCFFLKSRLLFNIFYCFCMFINKHSYISGPYISKSKRFYNAKLLSYYFYMKTKMLAEFRICISVPLNNSKCICYNCRNDVSMHLAWWYTSNNIINLTFI